MAKKKKKTEPQLTPEEKRIRELNAKHTKHLSNKNNPPLTVEEQAELESLRIRTGEILAVAEEDNSLQRATAMDKVYNVNIVKNYKTKKLSSFSDRTDVYSSSAESKTSAIQNSDILSVPNWSIKDFINERLKYRSICSDVTVNDVGSLYWEPGTYFYKLFFNFNTNFGLFGGIINNANTTNNIKITTGPAEYNTASMYLENNINSGRFTEHYRNVLKSKQLSLFKFTQILNYLTINCPWVFKEVAGLETVMESDFMSLAPAELPQIQISFNPDAIDMRISTLIDLYKHACFDYMNQKEIIPENLRKFDMSILVFNPPIKDFNMMMIEKYKTTKNKRGVEKTSFDGYDTIYGETGDASMTFKCIILKNCEFVLNGLKSISETLNNAEGFQSNLTISISYQRAFIYNVNTAFDTKTLDNYYDLENLVAFDKFTGNAKPETPKTTSSNASDESFEDYNEPDDYVPEYDELTEEEKIDLYKETHGLTDEDIEMIKANNPEMYDYLMETDPEDVIMDKTNYTDEIGIEQCEISLWEINEDGEIEGAPDYSIDSIDYEDNNTEYPCNDMDGDNEDDGCTSDDYDCDNDYEDDCTTDNVDYCPEDGCPDKNNDGFDDDYQCPDDCTDINENPEVCPTDCNDTDGDGNDDPEICPDDYLDDNNI